MPLSIRTNMASLESQRNMFSTRSAVDSSLSRLSSGYRITKAGDDAAGLGVSSNLMAQIRSYGQAVRNAQDGISLIQTAEGALEESSNILYRMRELAMQAASDGIGASERAFIQTETDALRTELNRIGDVTEFNGTKLLDGSATDLNFQVGIRNTANDRVTITTAQMDVADTNQLVGAALDVDSVTDAQAALATIDTAIADVSEARATFGAIGNRFNSTLSTIQVSQNNLSEAYSRIRDVDVAEETSRLTRNQILLQAGVSSLAQANQIPLVALKLLG